jgi:acetyltransferase-like isoleucine patch superfamily enzyme
MVQRLEQAAERATGSRAGTFAAVDTDATGPAWDARDPDRDRFEPWDAAYAAEPDPDASARRSALSQRPGYNLHATCYVAEGANVVASRLTVGEYTTIAAGCVVRGDVTIGAHCSLNAGAATIGRVRIGDFVRIAAYVVLVGENHGIDDLEQPIAVQPLTSLGVVVEDDVWIGANATIVDDVTIGAHSVVGAGAVVTRDVPPWSVVGGVPARVLRDRRTPRRTVRRDELADFDRRVSEAWPDVLARCEITTDNGRTYVDTPGADVTPRALNDAVEIAGAFGGLPDVAPRDELVARIQAMQDSATGMFIDPASGPPADPLAPSDREWDMYGLLSCGYALEVLGAGPRHPVHAVEACTPDRLRTLLDGLDMGLLAWPSGAWIDGFATGAHLNRRHHGSTEQHPMLWGWLATHVDRRSGMWGSYLTPMGDWDFRWLMAVNGFYRLTRGTYAQFGMPLPHPEAALDTVLAHAWDSGWFEDEERNACNVLDVIHPLWLCSQQTDHRAAEVRDAAARILRRAVADWRDGVGVPWDAHRDEAGLQGTEMWLAIVHTAAAVLGESDGLSWTPRGVHRLGPWSPPPM